jgi:chromosome segregation ATPase
MIRKLVVGSAVALALGTFVFGRDVLSYLRTGFHSVRAAVKSEVPIEFELQRARTLVDQLVPDIRQCMHVIAEQQVDIEHLNDSLARKEADLGKQREAILTLRADLGSGKGQLVYAGRTYSPHDVKRDLATRFERFKAAEEILAADRKILAAREQTLKANREKLDGMLQAKKELEVKLEQLQARLQTVRAAETVSTLAVDDSNLSHARALIAELNKQLDVREKILDAEGTFTGLIPVEATESPLVPEDIDQQIDAYFRSEDVPAHAGLAQD